MCKVDEFFPCDACHQEFPWGELTQDGELWFCPDCWNELLAQEGVDNPDHERP